MRKDINATDELRLVYADDPRSDKSDFGREVTFQLTEACNLACTYCYQTCKSSNTRMSWDTAKRCVDYLFELYEKDDPDGFINKNTKQIILDFIGGEPLIEIDLMSKICDYFYSECIKRRHEWASNFMISMASNGTFYFNPKVQEFLHKYRNHMSFSVSIDGTKEMHDACRIFPDGRGSFDLAKAAQDDYNSKYNHSIGTKATIARDNLPHLAEIVRYYDGQGIDLIHANCVYEEEWNNDDANLLYNQLKEAGDYILSLDHTLDLTFFEENFFRPKDEGDDQNWCGGTGDMLAFDPKGDAFPCIRYMHSSLNDDQPPLKIGDCWEGIYSKPETIQVRGMLESIDRRTQSTDECYYCPIAEGCSWCSGWNYQLYGTPNKRCTRICSMHKGRSLANVYYWNMKYIKDGSCDRFKRYLPDEEALKIISKEELDMLDKLSELPENGKYVNEVHFNWMDNKKF